MPYSSWKSKLHHTPLPYFLPPPLPLVYKYGSKSFTNQREAYIISAMKNLQYYKVIYGQRTRICPFTSLKPRNSKSTYYTIQACISKVHHSIFMIQVSTEMALKSVLIKRTDFQIVLIFFLILREITKGIFFSSIKPKILKICS